MVRATSARQAFGADDDQRNDADHHHSSVKLTSNITAAACKNWNDRKGPAPSWAGPGPGPELLFSLACVDGVVGHALLRDLIGRLVGAGVLHAFL